MHWWLNVFFLINGLWVPGHQLQGWGPRPHPTEALCLERKAFAERECRAYPLSYPSAWICSPGQPLIEVPASLLGLSC